MGLQHALAMVGGLITPPLVVSSVANDPGITQFLISSALIVSGICTIVHVIQLKIPFVPLYYGTGRSWCFCGFGFSSVICRALVLASVRAQCCCLVPVSRLFSVHVHIGKDSVCKSCCRRHLGHRHQLHLPAAGADIHWLHDGAFVTVTAVGTLQSQNPFMQNLVWCLTSRVDELFYVDQMQADGDDFTTAYG